MPESPHPAYLLLARPGQARVYCAMSTIVGVPYVAVGLNAVAATPALQRPALALVAGGALMLAIAAATARQAFDELRHPEATRNNAHRSLCPECARKKD